MTRAYRLAAVIEPDRSIRAENLPFSPGDRVEVIILNGDDQPATATGETWQRLKGSVLRYDHPTEPVGVEDWDSLK